MKSILTVVAAVAMLASSASAQKTVQTGKGGGGSPHMKGEWAVGGANITIEYGSPFLKGRPEAQLMPPGVEWRSGADQATVITSDKPINFGAVHLAPGSYTINTVPDAKQWKLILGKLGKPGQWGIPYLPALEIGRVPMKLAKTAAPVEQVTYYIDPTPNGGTLRIEWGTSSVSSPFTVSK